MSGLHDAGSAAGGTSSGPTDQPSTSFRGILLGAALVLSGATASGSAFPSTSADYPRVPSGGIRGTSSGEAGVPDGSPSREMVHDLRSISGLTWEQLSRLLNVSRRSIHLWASGGAVTPGNEEHMGRVLAVLRAEDRGIPGGNRAALLTPSPEGVVPFDLLRDMKYEAAGDLLRSTRGWARPRLTPLSEEELAARLPPPPDRLVGALRDYGQVVPKRSRVVRTIRTRVHGGR